MSQIFANCKAGTTAGGAETTAGKGGTTAGKGETAADGAGTAASKAGTGGGALAGRKIYSVGIYARLSVDSNSGKNESIENQIDIAKSYLEQQPDLALYQCYSDLGKTGTNFEREGFNKMMADVRSRKVDCIIVKDFSRFGRNYIETGNYLQKIFPFLGVRFISVTDHFDSLKGEGDSLGVNLKNLANEMYARDIAVKVKSSRAAQWEKGSYTGGVPPYGYRVGWKDGKKTLFIEPAAADIVRALYRLYERGGKMSELTKWLYWNKVHRPTDYRKCGHAICREGEELRQWPAGSVKLVLTNPVYMGCLVQARTCGKDYRLRKKHDIASEDWDVRENTHEAIVAGELFFRTAARFERQTVYSNRMGYSRNIPKAEDIFEGILFCGECGSRMERVGYVKEFGSKDRQRLYGYLCGRSSRIDSLFCEGKYITGHRLEELVKAVLKKEFFLAGMRPKELAAKNNELMLEKKRQLEKELKKIQRELEDGNYKESNLYLMYRSGDISREQFLNQKEKVLARSQKGKERQEEGNRRLQELEALAAKQNHFLRALLKFDEKTKLDREILAILVERIDIFPRKRIEIRFRFCGMDFYQYADMRGKQP